MTLTSFRAAFKHQPRWLKISEYLLAAYLLYALIAGLIIPAVLTAKLPGMLSQQLGRTVMVEDISINPFLLRARVSDFDIKSEDEQSSFVAFSALEVQISFWRSLLDLTPTIEHVVLSSPYSHVGRTAGGEQTRFNFSDIIEHIQANQTNDTQQDETKDNGVPHIRLNRFALRDGRLLLTDAVTQTTLDYPQLSIELVDLDTLATISVEDAGNADNRYTFDMTTTEGGSVDLTGNFQLSPLSVDGQLALHDIALPPLWRLSDNLIKAALTEGKLNFDIRYRVAEKAQDIGVTLTNGTLTLNDIVLADSEKPRISLSELSVQDIALDTLAKQVKATSITLTKPQINAVYDDSGIDLTRMLLPQRTTTSNKADSTQQTAGTESTDKTSDSVPAEGSQPAEGSHPAEGSAWQVSLTEFALQQGSAQIEEKAISDGVFWRIAPINLSTGEVSTDFSRPVSYQTDIAIAGRTDTWPEQPAGQLSSKGSVQIDNQRVTGTVEIAQIALAQVQPYLNKYVNITLTSGALSTTGKFEADATGKAVFDGQASISELNILDNLKHESLVKWQSMDVSDIHVDTQEQRLDIGTVALQSPYAKVLIDEQRNTNIGNLVKTSDASASDKPRSQQKDNPETDKNTDDTNAKSMAIHLNKITIDNGSAYFADNSLTPRFASGIESLSGSISDLASDAGTAANVDIQGKIDNYAPVALSGSVNPLLEEMFLDVNFSVDGAELTSVNPYASTYMGHYIDKGLLSLNVAYTLKDSQLQGKNHVVIDQLTLGRKTDSDKALSVPLGLAVALLEDSDGVIDLGLEVSGDLDNPSFSFGSIILNALGNLIKKAVTSPFTFLANLVGSDDELNEVTFTAGEASLSSDTRQKLDTLASALNERPGLRVNIEGTVNEVADSRELAIRRLHQQLLAQSGLDALPADLKASNLPQTGPLADALKTLYAQTGENAVEQEREAVIAQLQKQQAADSDNASQTEPAEEAVTRQLHIVMYNKLRNQINIQRSDLGQLANNRAKAVKNYLANDAGITANRLFLLNSRQRLTNENSSAILSLDAK